MRSILRDEPETLRREGQTSMPSGKYLSIVTPTFEGHRVQFSQLIESISSNCCDLNLLHMIVVVEDKNKLAFDRICASCPSLSYQIVTTEDVFAYFQITETPAHFLRRSGKFTFQSIKKFGGLLQAGTEWSLVLDSESVFHKPFSAATLLQDYVSRKYVFYTRTRPRTDLWRESTGFRVTQACGHFLAMDAGDRWYMEYFHWFYETEKVRDLIEHRLWGSFYDHIRDPESPRVDIFENVLYYLFLEKYHADEYNFVDFRLEMEVLAPDIAPRFCLSELPFSLFGNEYLLNIVSPDEVAALRPLFDKYALPFVRLEPPFFNTRYLPELEKLPSFVATISSHHLVWLRKKIAVCISGEFRHVVHRNPEHNLRHLLGFLSGVDCDIYLHGWSNTSEALILHELKPRAYRFEPRPSTSGLARRISYTEPNIKPGRDEGSLTMFYGLSRVYDLLEPHLHEYDFVLRIRPDIFADRSLKELLVSMSDEGDVQPQTIYVPQHFHSKGINDQFALGPTREMATYLQTYRWLETEIERLVFNPEAVLLRHLLEAKVSIALVHMPYALMRHHPMRIDSVHFHLHEQERVWWSRTDRLPLFEDLTAYFRDKLRCMEAIMRGEIPPVFHVPVQERDQDGLHRPASIRARVVDNDPALLALGFFRRGGWPVIGRFVLEEDGVEVSRETDQSYLFAYRDDGEMILVHWRMKDGKLVHHTIRVHQDDVTARATGQRLRHNIAWAAYRAERWTGAWARHWLLDGSAKRRRRLPASRSETSAQERHDDVSVAGPGTT